jgi:hypothetical protein
VELREIRTIGAREYREYDKWPRRQFDHPAPADEERGFKPLRVEPDYADATFFWR